MKRLFALLPIAGLTAGAILAGATLLSSTAVAQACKVDNGGLCQPEGGRCTEDGKKGSCKTRAIGTPPREWVCECKTGSSSRPERSERPEREPREEQEPQEESPE